MALPPTKRQGSGFTNLNRYLQANKGSKVGEAVQGGVEGNINRFKTGLSGAQEGFQKGVRESALDTDINREAQKNVLGRIGTLGSKAQVVGGEAQDNTPNIISQADVDQFGKFRAGAYGGPRNIGNEAGLLGQSQNLQGIGKATQTEAGRQGLLQQFLGKGGQYNQGQQKLDNLLFGQQANKLGSINRSVQGLAGQTSNQLGMARDQAQQQAAQNRAFGTDTQKTLDTEYKTRADKLAGDVTKFQGDQKTAYDTLVANTGNLQATNDPYLQSLAGSATWGVNPGDYITKTGTANAGNVLTPQQQAQMVALSRLGGGDASQVPEMSAGDRYDPSKAVGFNVGDYETARGQKRSNFYENVLPNYKQTINSGLINPETGKSSSSQQMDLPTAVNYYKQQAARTAPSPDAPHGLNDHDFYVQKANELDTQLQGIYGQYGVNTLFK